MYRPSSGTSSQASTEVTEDVPFEVSEVRDNDGRNPGDAGALAGCEMSDPGTLGCPEISYVVSQSSDLISGVEALDDPVIAE